MSAPAFRPAFGTPAYEWHVAITHDDAPPAPDCQPVTLERYAYSDEAAARRGEYAGYDHSEHRGACWGCDWLGPVRAQDEQAATEDAHDHAFPGWRDLPAMEPLPYDASPAAIRQAQRAATLLYPDGWRHRCGPTISWRLEGSSRHVPGRGLFGGYDMGRVRPGDSAAARRADLAARYGTATADRLMQDPEPARPMQASLFEEVGQ